VRTTAPSGATANQRSGSVMPQPTRERARSTTPNGPGAGRNPRRRAQRLVATSRGPDDQSPVVISTGRMPAPRRLVFSSPMAKARRRKIQARRSKANHGRRPNAGRGH